MTTFEEAIASEINFPTRVKECACGALMKSRPIDVRYKEKPNGFVLLKHHNDEWIVSSEPKVDWLWCCTKCNTAENPQLIK